MEPARYFSSMEAFRYDWYGRHRIRRAYAGVLQADRARRHWQALERGKGASEGASVSGTQIETDCIAQRHTHHSLRNFAVCANLRERARHENRRTGLLKRTDKLGK